jgi:formyltetrahydrofolate-dependent phosphoribosylglycinamide formyltransferase
LSKLVVSVFVSGRGSNLRVLVNSNYLTSLITIGSVVSDKGDCDAITYAKENGISTFVVGKSGLSYSEIADKLVKNGTGLVILAGFLKLIPAEFIKIFENKIINIHPALLPNFGGKGLYGHFVHEAVYISGARVSGATVHFVNNEYDKGYIISQRAVDISDVKSADEIAGLVLKIEHNLLPETVALFAQERIKILNERVEIVYPNDSNFEFNLRKEEI